MTPKQYAEHLINRFHDPYLTDTGIENAKRCARICVEEILKQANNWGVTAVRFFWENVKKEIENI